MSQQLRVSDRRGGLARDRVAPTLGILAHGGGIQRGLRVRDLLVDRGLLGLCLLSLCLVRGCGMSAPRVDAPDDGREDDECRGEDGARDGRGTQGCGSAHLVASWSC